MKLFYLAFVCACILGYSCSEIDDVDECELPFDERFDMTRIEFQDSVSGLYYLFSPSIRYDFDSIFVMESSGLLIDYEVDDSGLYFSLSRPLKDSLPFTSTELRTFYINLPNDVDTLAVEYSIFYNEKCNVFSYDFLEGMYNGQTISPAYIRIFK